MTRKKLQTVKSHFFNTILLLSIKKNNGIRNRVTKKPLDDSDINTIIMERIAAIKYKPLIIHFCCEKVKALTITK